VLRENEIPRDSLSNVEWLKGDLLDPVFVDQATKDCAVVFHLAAVKGNIFFHSEHSADILKSNLRMDLNVLEAAVINSVSRVLMIGSATAGDSWLDSGHFGYAWSKKMSEVLSESFRRQYGLKSSVIRLENVFGPGDSFDPKVSQVIPSVIYRAFQKENPFKFKGNPDTEKDFSYVEDVTFKLIELAADYSLSNIVILKPSYRVTFKNLVEKIARISNLESKIEFIESEVVKKNSADIDSDIPFFEVKDPTPFEEAIRRTITWYQDSLR
ncbi:MAG: NAD-dependent epimerase/dehydratase family protein, partial [bacterium]|nr:NAD-dependent epimerase/dehydratase family protein [bacterium]